MDGEKTPSTLREVRSHDEHVLSSGARVSRDEGARREAADEDAAAVVDGEGGGLVVSGVPRCQLESSPPAEENFIAKMSALPWFATPSTTLPRVMPAM